MGPLDGIKIIEVSSLGPGPFAAMMLTDMGAEVLSLDRAQNVGVDDSAASPAYLMNRGRRNVALDLKHPKAVEVALRLVENADGLLEGFRPGVMERLGLGPSVCLDRNPRLVYGRMTGFGQEGPLAQTAGHDINYIALAGALHPLGRMGERPTAPLNLLGDFGGGGMLLAFGMVCALMERHSSGKGQVVDAAMVDGASLLMTMVHGMRQAGYWNEDRGTNMLDSGAHFYDTYETSDNQFVSIGSIEPQFYAKLLDNMGLAGEDLPEQMDAEQWPQLKRRFEKIFRSKTRDEWCKIMEGSDVCFAPVLSMEEAPKHPQMMARRTFVESYGVVQPAPAPRFSRTTPELGGPPALPGEHTDEALRDWGFDADELRELRGVGAIR